MSHLILPMAHLSMQFSDTHKQQRHDVSKFFGMNRNFPIKSGTEAGLDRSGSNMNRDYLEEFASKYKHAIHFAQDNWIAVDREIIRHGSIERGRVFVASNDEMVGHGHDRVFATFQFIHRQRGVGKINLAAVHYPTKGATAGDPNHKLNVRYAEYLSAWCRRVGTGQALAFINGDFNTNDMKYDWAYGGNFTSIADNLNKHRNTGHGPIDGFASYDRDGRVSAESFVVHNDKKTFFHSDHFMVRAKWKVRLLEEAA